MDHIVQSDAGVPAPAIRPLEAVAADINAAHRAAQIDDSYFGTCPVCQKAGTALNIGRDHWSACHDHRKCWSIGSNLFSGWQHETEQDWTHNKQRLQGYEIVEPWYPEIEPEKLTEFVEPF